MFDNLTSVWYPNTRIISLTGFRILLNYKKKQERSRPGKSY